MSNIVLFSAGAQLPAYLQNKATLALINADVASPGGFPVLSIKGKVFALVRDKQRKVLTRHDDPDEILQNLNLAVVRANKNARVFYAKEYAEDDSENGASKLPDCYSGDGVAPASDAKDPQSKKCQLCPHAVWGSGKNGTGTACSVNTRLAVVDPDNVGEPWLLRVPAGSRANFANACKVTDSRGLPYNAVIFKVGFDPLAPAPKLTFKPIGLAGDEAYAKISEMYDSDEVKDIIGLLPHAPRAAQESDEPEITAEELDAALEAKTAATAAFAKAKAAKPAPAAAKAPVADFNMDDIEDVVSKAEVEMAPAKPKAQAEPAAPAKAVAPKAAAPKAPAKPKAPAEAAPDASMDDLMGDLDALLGSTDD
jgi:hypothetical protein